MVLNQKRGQDTQKTTKLQSQVAHLGSTHEAILRSLRFSWSFQGAVDTKFHPLLMAAILQHLYETLTYELAQDFSHQLYSIKSY